MEALTPEAITAIVASFTALGAFFVSPKRDKQSEAGLLQPLVRPETEAELRQAAALEKIAAAVDRIERHIDVWARSS